RRRMFRVVHQHKRETDMQSIAHPGEDAMLEIDGLEELSEAGEVLAPAEQEEPAAIQAVMEHRNQPLMELRSEVDEHVAAADEVELCEGGIACQIVDDEHAPIADALGDPPLLPCAMEEPLQAMFPQVAQCRLRVESRPRALDGPLAPGSTRSRA